MSFVSKHAVVSEWVYVPRVLLWIGGHAKRGKSRMAMTAPSPIAYFEIDMGMGRALEPMLNGDAINILTGEPFKPRIHVATYSQKWSTQPEYKAELDRMESDLVDAIKDPDIRTIVIDTWAEARNIAIKGLLGLGKISQIRYGEVNALLDRWLDLIVDTQGKNLVLLSHLKERYAQAIDQTTGEPSKSINDSYATGEWYPAGHRDTDKKVQAYVELDRARKLLWFEQSGSPITELIEHDGRMVPARDGKRRLDWDKCDSRMETNPTGEFYATIKMCGQRTSAEGVVLREPDNTIPVIANLMFPNVEVEHWT